MAIKLPNRKWYTLQQAAEKLSKEYRETITVSDVIHYANIGELELLTNIDFSMNQFDEYNLSIQGVELNKIMDSIIGLEFRGFSTKPNIELYQYENATLIIKDNFDFFNLFPAESDDEDYEYDDEENDIFEDGINLNQEKFRLATLNNKKINLMCNIEKAKGFFAIDFINYNNLFLDETNLRIKSYDISLRFSRHCKNTNGLNIILRGIDKSLSDIIILNSKSIFIQSEELDLFINQRIKLRSLLTVDDYIEEWKNPTREISATEPSKKVQKSQGGRPTPHKDKIIELAHNIFEKYPENNLESIARATLEIINNNNYLNDQNLNFSMETIRRYLKEGDIGKHRGKSSNINALQFLKPA